MILKAIMLYLLTFISFYMMIYADIKLKKYYSSALFTIIFICLHLFLTYYSFHGLTIAPYLLISLFGIFIGLFEYLTNNDDADLFCGVIIGYICLLFTLIVAALAGTAKSFNYIQCIVSPLGIIVTLIITRYIINKTLKVTNCELFDYDKYNSNIKSVNNAIKVGLQVCGWILLFVILLIIFL